MEARPPRTAPARLTGAVGAAVVAAAATTVGACGAGTDAAHTGTATATFVGQQVCAGCHEPEVRQWTGSHHDRAMQEATGDAVLGDFGGATFTSRDVTSTFTSDGGRPRVRTEGPDGLLHDYDVAYTFGWTPLQQYLVPFPGGRFQVLGIAWDSRPAEAGGQRWFQLPEGVDIAPGSRLHWTAPGQTWNAACASCHSTGLRKGFEAASRTYRTTWSEPDVSCEACHGPGSAHVALAQESGSSEDHPGFGLVTDPRRPAGTWSLEPGRSTATWVAAGPAPESPRAPATTGRPSPAFPEVELCARCHSRRSDLTDHQDPGERLLDGYRPALLRADLYHPDGQILDEVYVWGSFVQSRMYAAGVTCSDCHDPHTLEPRAEGNALCTRCHRADRYDDPGHHFHPPGSTGARCVECHMPATTYMVVDPRRDHGLRIPRPDLAVRLGVPDPCTGCHTGRSAAWAAREVEARYGPPDTTAFAGALAGGRATDPAARDALVELAGDRSRPAIVRATALSLLPGYPRARPLATLRRGLADPDPLVRLGAVEAADGMAPTSVLELLLPRVVDSTRAVRLEAARLLAAIPPGATTPRQAAVIDRAGAEYEAAQLVNADHPSAWVNLGDLRAARGRPAEAEEAYREALALDPTWVPAHLDLADLQRALGRDDLAEATLSEGLRLSPGAPELLHAMGLLRVRQGHLGEAVGLLARAATTRPEDARFAYVYGVALASAGDTAASVRVLEDAAGRHPWDRNLLTALATYSRDLGDVDAAWRYARRLVQVVPEDAAVRELVRELASRRR